jgi:hypothetical protein
LRISDYQSRVERTAAITGSQIPLPMIVQAE